MKGSLFINNGEKSSSISSNSPELQLKATPTSPVTVTDDIVQQADITSCHSFNFQKVLLQKKVQAMENTASEH